MAKHNFCLILLQLVHNKSISIFRQHFPIIFLPPSIHIICMFVLLWFSVLKLFNVFHVSFVLTSCQFLLNWCFIFIELMFYFYFSDERCILISNRAFKEFDLNSLYHISEWRHFGHVHFIGVWSGGLVLFSAGTPFKNSVFGVSGDSCQCQWRALIVRVR